MRYSDIINYSGNNSKYAMKFFDPIHIIENQLATYWNNLELHERMHNEFRIVHDGFVSQFNYFNNIINIINNYAQFFNTLNRTMCILEYEMVNHWNIIKFYCDELESQIHYTRGTLAIIEYNIDNTQDMINKLSIEKENLLPSVIFC
jgi:hypothetical protein